MVSWRATVGSFLRAVAPTRWWGPLRFLRLVALAGVAEGVHVEADGLAGVAERLGGLLLVEALRAEDALDGAPEGFVGPLGGLPDFVVADAAGLEEFVGGALSRGGGVGIGQGGRSEEHTSELQSREKLVCRHLLAKKK